MNAPHTSADTPVMRQFLDIKRQFPDAIVMFRMGDFYEMFFDDAITVGPVLEIAVTTRDKGEVENPVPMAGVPYHAIGGYLRTLVERGFKVAICEQMETPEQARLRKGPNKIVRREVVRVVTPGVLVDEEHLRGEEPNYLVALVHDAAGSYGLGVLDISCGEFFVVTCEGAGAVRAALSRLLPREIVCEPGLHPWLGLELGPLCPRLEGRDPAAVGAAQLARVKRLREESGGESLAPVEERAAALALAYAEDTQPGQTLLLHRLRRQAFEAHLVLDDASLRNLEVFRTLRDGQRKGSLLWAVDATRTAMGARLLRAWLGAPLRALGAIRERHDAVEALLAEPRVRGDLQDRLRDVRDIARLAARARLGTVSPRELAALRQSLAALPGVAELLGELARRRAPLLTEGQVPTDMSDGAGLKGQAGAAGLPVLLDLGEDLLQDVHAALVRLLVDDPPAHQRDGGMIRAGADPELDRQLGLRDGGREALAAIEARERERTGIANLRVQHNRVFGYYIEVLKTQLSRVPAEYVRKQTTANAERYVTAELAEHETAVLGAVAAALEREQQLFTALREQVSAAGDRLLAVAEALARLDVLAGLAEIAESHAYVRPDMVEEPVLDIEEGRHPVVERMLDAGRFVPNNLALRASTTQANGAGRLMLLTGPNMGGKSTAMRMAALVAILAHAGAFVPAVRARVGVVDRVFTRVGAADDLGRGESTFMVEMREAAQILSQATPRSLVLLDEIGRGTATYDGLALAWAITEFLHDQIGCRSLFATHYHELTQLQARLVGLRNAHVTVHEERGSIVFLHRVEPGPAERSYGIQVGRLAGLPASVLRRAQKLLTRLEQAQGEARPVPQLDLFTPPAPAPQPADSVPPPLAAILADLRALHPDELSPRNAHEALRRLHERLVAVEGGGEHVS
ncbi:DNA mismatch repair protein MutS [Nannocystis pusilla]|uniref:DNA mismatch repair protein MutS n=1 Tax=Nannocystis pusilla TaxID=889268 RepID=UPI003BF08AEC